MKTGDIAPNFNLIDQYGNDFELYKNLNKKVLLVFYPKDKTPVCSTQLAEYNQNLKEFDNQGIKLVAISSDSVDSHLQFCSNLKLNFPLLSDASKNIIKSFKAVNFIGLSKRKLILINTDKKILWIGNMLSVNYLKTEEILNSVESLEW